MTEAEDSMRKIRAKLLWLYREIARQHKLGNKDTARRFEVVANAAAQIANDLDVYVSRNPRAKRGDLLEILRKISDNN